MRLGLSQSLYFLIFCETDYWTNNKNKGEQMIKIASMADFHLGILDVDFQYEQFEKNFLSFCIKNEPDIIVIAGDLMHRRVSLNSKASLIFNMIIDKLITLDYNPYVLFVNGTKSHDDDQIKAVMYRTSEKFRVYTEVTYDRIMGLDLLLIPEEYMHDPEEYYKDYLNREYDFVFGHGMANHISYTGPSVNYKRLTSPTWDYDKQFKDIIRGCIKFGHIHTHSKRDKWHYIGSFGRYNHGEEEPKGFMYTEYDEKKHKIVKDIHIETKDSLIFKTVNESDLPNDRDKMLEYLKELANKVYRLRISIDREVSKERKLDVMQFSKTNPIVHIDLKNERKRRKLELGSKDAESIRMANKYEGLNIIDASVEFIKEKYDMNISRSKISDVLIKDIGVKM